VVPRFLPALLLACAGNSASDSAAPPGDTPSAWVTRPLDSASADSASDSGGDTAETGDTGPVIDRDIDDDGFIDEAAAGDDCDDNNAQVFPGAPELCDDADQSCDGDGWLGADCGATQSIAGMGVLLAGSPLGAASIVRDVTGDGVDDVMDGSYWEREPYGLMYWTATEIPVNPGYFPGDNNVAAFYEYSDLIDHRLDFGDVDGDGYNDVGHVPGGVYGYSTLLFRGPIPTDGTWVESYESDYQWSASPDMEWEDCWSCGAITGDWNGDGLGDLALAAWDDTEPEEDGGLVVYWGGTLGDERLTLGGNHIFDLDALGDVTGDGADDMAIDDLGGAEKCGGSTITCVGWIDGTDLSAAVDLERPIDVAFATVVDADYNASSWAGVRDWDGDGLADPEAVVVPRGDDTEGAGERLVFHGLAASTMQVTDGAGGFDLPGTALEHGITSGAHTCTLGGTEQVLYQSGTTWALFEPPATLPPRHSAFPDRMLVFERAYGADCGDVTGDGAEDLVFGAREDWMDDRAHVRVIPGWEIPWDDDAYWP